MAVPVSRKCAQCGLVNFSTAEVCRRCGQALSSNGELALDAEPAPEAPPRTVTRGVGRRILWLAGVLVAAVFGWSRSLLLTSEPIDAQQQATVYRSIQILNGAGFSREAAMLRHFANFRATDNWWNVYLGHHDAYAATNFPLGVLTLYEPFFRTAVDDNERAIILLHEAQHLIGCGEDTALERVWREKRRLGWIAEQYGETKVWKNTQEWTRASVPSLFACGASHTSDCAP